MTPLEELTRLLRKYGHSAEAVTMNSLAAREEARVEGERFWADLAGTDMFGEKGSIAAVSAASDIPANRYRALLRGVAISASPAPPEAGRYLAIRAACPTDRRNSGRTPNRA